MDKTVSKGYLKGTLPPPCSKSYAQRALAMALLARGCTTLHNIEFCDDTRAAIRCIEALGARITRTGDSTLEIEGGMDSSGRLSHAREVLYVGESGLSTRLFTPIAALTGHTVRIEGEGSILRRPMGMMIEPLRALGVEVHHRGGHLPFEVKGPIRGGEIEIDGSISSQFVTGLLTALPSVDGETVLHVRNAVSTPYLDMTIDAAAQFGVKIDRRDYEEFYIEGGQEYTARTYSIEGDWSAAAMMLVAGAVAGEVSVENIRPLSCQADTLILRALMRSRATVITEGDTVTVSHNDLRAFEFDATDSPDLFPALAALAANAEGTSRLRGIHRLVHKESDRAETLCEEYSKLGIDIRILPEEDSMLIRGGKIGSGHVSSHGDHRIAMSLAVAGLNAEGEGVCIEGAECVAKSYPRFFEDLERLRIHQ